MDPALTGISSGPAGLDPPPRTPEQIIPPSLPASPPSQPRPSTPLIVQHGTITDSRCPIAACTDHNPHSHYNVAHVIDIYKKPLTDEFMPRHRGYVVDDLLRPPSASLNDSVLQKLDAEPSPQHMERRYRWIHCPANDIGWAKPILNNVRRHLDSRSWATVRPLPGTSLQHPPRNGRSFFADQENFRTSRSLHARFMKQCSKRWEDRMNSTRIETFIMMPYLHWEQKSLYKHMRALVKKCEELLPVASRPDSSSSLEYDVHFENRLRDDHEALHIRRSLDQSFYWSLPNIDYRDNDQVIDRYFDKVAARQRVPVAGDSTPVVTSSTSPDGIRGVSSTTRPEGTDSQGVPKPRHLLMVDQMWMWILNEGHPDCTIVTFFPQTWAANTRSLDPIDLFTSILSTVKDHLASTDKSATYSNAKVLALLILDRCASNLVDTTLVKQDDHQYLQIFNAYIDMLMDDQKRCIDGLGQAVVNANVDSDPVNISSQYANGNPSFSLYDIAAEYDILKDIRDIVEELTMMRHILDLQISAIKAFQYEYRHHTKSIDGVSVPFVGRPYGRSHAQSTIPSHVHTEPDNESERQVFANRSRRATMAGGTLGPLNIDIPRPGGNQYARNLVDSVALHEPRADPDRRKPVDELLERCFGRIGDLKKLQDKAQLVDKSITRLLELKQQQANIAEVRTSRFIAEASEKQSQAVMLFTVVTIIFLPLTSVASIYGMNAADFDQGDVPLKHIFKIMFPTSAGIALFILYLAFHERVRTVLGLLFVVPYACIMLIIPPSPLDSLVKAMERTHETLKTRRKKRWTAPPGQSTTVNGAKPAEKTAATGGNATAQSVPSTNTTTSANTQQNTSKRILARGRKKGASIEDGKS